MPSATCGSSSGTSLAGIAATALQTFVTLDFGTASDASIPNVGASGAIAGVLGAYFLLLPRASVLTAIFLGFFFIFREIPAIFFLGFWIVLQAIDGTLSITTPASGGRRRVLRAHRRLRLRRAHREALQAARAVTAGRPAIAWRDASRSTFAGALDTLPPELARGSRTSPSSWRTSTRRIRTSSGCSRSSPYLPAKITIFRLPLEESFSDPRELEREIRITVLHELAHYFGIDEGRLEELGYD